MDRDGLISHIPLGFLIGLLVMVGFLLREAGFGRVQPQLVTAAATFVLVAGTIYYAWQSRKSTEQTERTLEAMEKDREKYGRILSIAYGIDPIRETLEGYHGDWTRFGVGCFPRIERKWRLPDSEFIADLEEVYPDIEDDFEHFIASIETYSNRWHELGRQLKDQIKEDHREELQEYEDENAVSGDLPMILAMYTLNPEDSLGHKDLWHELESELAMYRDHQVYGDMFDEIDQLHNDVVDENRAFQEKLGEARGALKTEYGITDLEIEEAKKESPLEDPEIIVSPLPIRI